LVELNGQLEFADPDILFEYYDWNIAKTGKTRLEKDDFNIEEIPGQGFNIDLNGNKMQYNIAGKEQYLPYMTDIDVWDPINLIHWLDRNLKQADIPQPQMVSWLQKVIDYLISERKIVIQNLVIAKFALLNKLQAIITEERKKARNKSFSLFQEEYRKTLDFDTGFEFKNGMYDILIPYTGKYKFTKHFLGNKKIAVMNKEETECAQVIDALDETEFWLRNIENKSASFKLPTSTDFFYPDFVAKLKDNRILVVEYKGAFLATNEDTKEKDIIGRIWEEQSDGKALFLIVEKNKDGKTMEQQIKDKINVKR